MSGFTPGPWKWVPHKNQPHLFDLVGGNGNLLYRVVVVPEMDAADGDDDLMTAAPDLLEALCDLVENGIGTEAVKRARAAIAKARGES